MRKRTAKTQLLLIQMLWGAGKILQPSYRKLDEGFEAWAYRNGLLKQVNRLEELGYLESQPGSYDQKRVHRLTEAGRLEALGGRDPDACWKRVWDRTWRIFLFDIPESERSDRRRLTRALASMGYGCLQGSVWIAPFHPSELRSAFKEDGDDCAHLMVLEARSRGLEVDRRMVAVAWDYSKINDLYRRYLKVLEELPASADGTSPSKLIHWGAQENNAWLEAVRSDPLLPSRLLPKGYLGRKAWQRRKKALQQAGQVATSVLVRAG